MQELFAKVDAFIADLKANAADAAAKASDVLRQAADWIDQQASGVKFAASPADIKGCEQRCNELQSILDAGCEPGDEDVTTPKRGKHHPATSAAQPATSAAQPATSAAQPAGFGPGVTLAIQFILALLQGLMKPQKQPPA